MSEPINTMYEPFYKCELCETNCKNLLSIYYAENERPIHSGLCDGCVKDWQDAMTLFHKFTLSRRLTNEINEIDKRITHGCYGHPCKECDK